MRIGLLIYRLYDPTYGKRGNSKTLAVNLNEDNTLSYSFYGGWQDSGSEFAISNLQMSKSLPMTIRGIRGVKDLDKEIRLCLKTGVGSHWINEVNFLNNFEYVKPV